MNAITGNGAIRVAVGKPGTLVSIFVVSQYSGSTTESEMTS